MKKENKEKLKNTPSSTMEELFRRGEVGEFDHLKEIGELKEKSYGTESQIPRK